MIVKQADVLKVNDGYLKDWVPTAAGASHQALVAEAGQRISVWRDGQDQALVKVTFHTDLAWAIRDGTPDVQEAVDWLKSLVGFGASGAAGAGGSASSIVLNGVTSALDVTAGAARLVDSIIQTQEQPFYGTFVVQGEVAQSTENVSVSCNVQGNLRTSDTGNEEHACIPLAKIDLNGEDNTDSTFNVGLSGISPIRMSKLKVGPKQLPTGPFLCQLDLESILKTNGRVIGSTISAIYIRRVEFTFTRSAASSGTHVAPGGAPAKPAAKPESGGAGVGGGAAAAASGATAEAEAEAASAHGAPESPPHH